MSLCTVSSVDTPFSQYVPGNFRPLLGRDGTVCVGAVYGGSACGVALAERERESYYLRYIFIDPVARLCGLGTYLLRGLLGQLRDRGGLPVKAIYTSDMLEDGRQTLGILERAGFSHPKPFATVFSTRLGDIPEISRHFHADLTVYSALEIPEAVREAYLALLEAGVLPEFADAGGLRRPWAELSSFCVVRGALSGLLLVDRKGEGCHLAGLYVLPPFRNGPTAAALIARSLEAARALLPPDTPVWTSVIDRNAYSLCDKLLRLGSQTRKETEFRSVYLF